MQRAAGDLSFRLRYGGCAALSTQLGDALIAQWHPLPRRGVICDYAYPAAMRLECANILLDVATAGRRRGPAPRTRVYDPFVGGGTVLDAALDFQMTDADWVGGGDASPLAVFASAHRCWRPPPAALKHLATFTSRLGRGVSKTRGDWRFLRALVQDEADEPARGGIPRSGAFPDATSALVYTYLVSRQRHLFKKESHEAIETFRTVFHALLEKWGRRQLVVGENARVHVRRRDARSTLDIAVDAVVTSPPYPGVYDYLQEARKVRTLFWGGQESFAMTDTDAITDADADTASERGFLADHVPSGVSADRESREDWPSAWSDSAEIGAYRDYKKIARGGDSKLFREKWAQDQTSWLAAAAQMLEPGGRVAIVVGDGAFVDTLSATAAVAAHGGLFDVAATATIESTVPEHVLRKTGNRRTEHALLLVRN
mmetsp:Transcript_23881/g.82591  ORF Transcript_23881/g.82591 Transcript_23881/m.82591 type:complete len:429 (-) Transcript_23881:28-1314(-)